MRSLSLSLGAFALAGLACMAEAQDQPADTTTGLKIELNSATDTDGACRISFVVENALGADLSEAVFETVLFDTAGSVERLTLFDMRDLPDGRPRVRQFQIDGIACDGIGRILFNGVQACTGEGLDDGACMDGLGLTSRTEIEVLG